MQRLTLDLDVLRTYVAGIDLGTFAKAADRLGRSTSAVSSQLKKLEEQLGTPLLRKSGRRLLPTEAGETLFAYARRLLELNDEAVSAVSDIHLEGRVRIGLQQDFGEGLLTKILGNFVGAHPRIHLEVSLASNQELIDGIRSGRFDLAVAWRGAEETPYCRQLAELPMRWIRGANFSDLSFSENRPLPLALMENPCLMRVAALNALDKAGIPWRIAFTSPSLSGIWSAVAAGIGLTVRTPLGLPEYLRVQHHGLPQLPTIGLIMHHAQTNQTEVVQRLSGIITKELQSVLFGSSGPPDLDLAPKKVRPPIHSGKQPS